MPVPIDREPRRAGPREQALFRPRSVALLGDRALPEAAILARNLVEGGFQGPLHGIGVQAPGLATVSTPDALPVAPDLGILALPAAAIPHAMRALAERGCRAVLVPGAADDLAGHAAITGQRALGPWSFGLAVPEIGLNATLAHRPPRHGRLALVGQSAALTRAILDWADAEAVGFSHVIGIGGNAQSGFATALDWLARDAATGAVLLELRLIRDRRAFVSAARAVARTRPVVALRPGGRLADPSGRADAVLGAALRRAGVLRVQGLGELLGAAETLARAKLRPGTATGDRLAIVADALGPALLASDAALGSGLRLAELQLETRAAVALLRPDVRPGNPLVASADNPAGLAETAAMLAAMPEIDIVVALHAPAPGPAEPVAATAMVAAVGAGRPGAGRHAAPILVGWTGGAATADERARLGNAGLAVFETPEAAVRGAAHLAEDRRNRAALNELPARDVLDIRPNRAAVAATLAAVAAAGRLDLREDEALGLLTAYGIPVVPGHRTAGPREAAEAAALLSFPVVLKALSPDLPHKSEVGGVRLGLADAEAVRAAACAMADRLAAERPGVRLHGFLVQRQVAAGLELRLRLGDDAMFGPWIGFGQGGTTAEFAGDEAFELPPLNLALAQALIDRSRTARVLDGWREFPAADRAGVAGALVRLSQLAIDWPEIESLTINPLLADRRGVLAIDAECRLRPPGARGLTAIAPYPAELAGLFHAPTGPALTVRPIRPEDAAAHAAMFGRLSPQDIRYRFFSPLRAIPPVLTARLTQIDYDREMAFVAIESDAAGEVLRGVARLIRDPSTPGEAEFAVLVDPARKGQGLARHLMHRLFEWGRSVGVRRVVGQVLAENEPMLAFVRALGFDVRRSADEEDVVEASRSI